MLLSNKEGQVMSTMSMVMCIHFLNNENTQPHIIHDFPVPHLGIPNPIISGHR